jgi:hypothetical protein|tara:strand:- start:160 stop:360 length:201 start_codon:yes stop_codon:yes gene_type:complete
MYSFKQFLEEVDPVRYTKIIHGESLSTKKWKENEMKESIQNNWEFFDLNPESTDKFINWVTQSDKF